MTMILQDAKRKRIPFTWISFCDVNNGIDGYAEGWFFWVSKSFKPALDIFYIEKIDKKETLALRDKMSHKLFELTHQQLKDQIKSSGMMLEDSDKHQEVMGYSRKNLIETEGSPLLLSFRETDSLESRCGNWYIQVTQAVATTQNKAGEVGFQLFKKKTQDPKSIWERNFWYSTTQEDFVNLLKYGISNAINLTNMHQQQDVESVLNEA